MAVCANSYATCETAQESHPHPSFVPAQARLFLLPSDRTNTCNPTPRFKAEATFRRILSWNILRCQTASKTIIPFCTHAGSGLDGIDAKIRSAVPNATIGTPLAVYGTTAQNEPREAQRQVVEWLNH